MKRLLIGLGLGLAFEFLPAQTPVINEVMSRNSSLIPDAEGDFHDWIEIYNPGLQPIRLDEYSLSDDPNLPDKWKFPEFELEARSFTTVYASNEDPRENTAFVTVVTRGDEWNYQPGSAAVSRSWYVFSYNDDSWPKGPSGIGFGRGADPTAAAQSTCLFGRKSFMLSEAYSVTRAVFHIDYEDGFVAYINGREVARKNMGAAGNHPPWNSLATAPAEPRMRRGLPPEAFEIRNMAGLFREGENVLAVEVHVSKSGAQDLTMIPFLTVGKSAPEGSFQVAEGLQVLAPPFHANFKIKSGEILLLSDPAGALLDTIRIRELPVSLSAGRFPDGRNAWRWMSSPTPGYRNQPPFVSGIIEAPVFNLQGGYYSSGRVVTVAPASSGDTVRVTADGSDPTPASPASNGPIQVRNTAVLRGRSFRAGFLPSPIVTQTYLISEKRDLPVVSLTTDPENLWNEDTGIYVMGRNPGTENPYFGANFWQEWEKPVHVEFFETDGSRAFGLDAGIKIYGAWSRAWDQKSVALYVRNDFGSGETDHRIFPGLPIRRFVTFLLRNSGNDWQYTMFRDGLMQTLVENRTAIDVLAYRPAVLFLNGDYWGLMNLREKPDKHYLAAHHGVDPDDLDLLAFDAGSGAAVIDGRPDDYLALLASLGKMDMSTKEAYGFVHDRIDLDNYIDYMISQIYFDNTDWPGNNMKFWKARTPGAKWRWILFDTDFGFALYDGNGANHNTLEFALDPAGPGWPNPPRSTFLLRKLVENPVFRERFISRAADHLNATFEKRRVLAVIDSLAAAIASEIPLHQDRWPGSARNWEAAVDVLRDFAGKRVQSMRAHFAGRFKIPGTVQIVVTVSDRAAGRIRVNTLDLRSFPWTGTYFKTIPVSITAVPNPGFRFAGWSDPALGDSVTASFAPFKSVYLSARFEPSSDAANAVINEINYHSPESFDPGDWVELVNPTDASLDVSGWSFRNGTGNPYFIFPERSVLPARGYSVLSADTTSLKLLFPDIPGRVNGIPFTLKNSGDTLVLADRNGFIIDSLVYGDDGPWPTEADGAGCTLALGSPSEDNTDPASWTASRYAGGTPGRPNSTVTAVPASRDTDPAEFRLYGNFPNPFNASTVIRWSVASRSAVNVSVFDILGRCVRTFADGISAPGEYAARWDAPVSSGVYLLRMNAVLNGKSFTRSRKLVCVR